MRTMVGLMAFVMAALFASSCSQQHTVGSLWGGSKRVKGSKVYVTKEMKVGDFDRLQVTGGADVEYTQTAGTPKVKVYTSDNIVELLDIRVKNGTLCVGFKKNVNVSYDKLLVRISSETLDGISVAGSGDVKLMNGLKTEQLKVSVAGSGDIDASRIECGSLAVSIAGSGDIECEDVVCNELEASVSGSGDMELKNVSGGRVEVSVAGSGTVKLSGRAQEAAYSVAGSGDVYAKGLQTERVTAGISGSGNVECYATDYLKARTSGSGTVAYKGNPEVDYPKKGLKKID